MFPFQSEDWCDEIYPLVINIAMENHHFYWEISLYMAIFSSYLNLPEGMHSNFGDFRDWFYQAIGLIPHVVEPLVNHTPPKFVVFVMIAENTQTSG